MSNRTKHCKEVTGSALFLRRCAGCVFLCLLCAIATSCSEAETKAQDFELEDDSIVRIHWEGGIEVEECRFYVENRPVGSGRKGFDRVRSYIEKIAKGGTVHVSAPMEEWRDLQHHFDSLEVFPFEREFDAMDYISVATDGKSLRYTRVLAEPIDTRDSAIEFIPAKSQSGNSGFRIF